MANYKRRRARANTRGNLDNMSHWPAWWDLVFHTRPKRRKGKALTTKIVKGDVDPDAAVWPLGNHKPHRYYW